jgi:hypothetical protein
VGETNCNKVFGNPLKFYFPNFSVELSVFFGRHFEFRRHLGYEFQVSGLFIPKKQENSEKSFFRQSRNVAIDRNSGRAYSHRD